MKTTYLITVLLLVFSISSFAHPHGKGQGKGQDVQRQVLKDDGSTVDATKPPGLRGSHYPPGLKKLNKTPPGWSHGKKVGWEKEVNMMHGKGKVK